MRAAERSMSVFGVYLAIVGLSLVLVPNLVLGLLGIAATGEVWIRVTGALTFALACYFVAAGRAGSVWFMRTSIAVRCLVALRGAPLAGAG